MKQFAELGQDVTEGIDEGLADMRFTKGKRRVSNERYWQGQKGEVYLKWLIDCRTASSNSMGPGIINAGCCGWLDIFLGTSGSSLASSFFSVSNSFFFLIRLPCSSSRCADRSVEKGVLSSRDGLGSKCLANCERREVADVADVGEAREGAMEG